MREKRVDVILTVLNAMSDVNVLTTRENALVKSNQELHFEFKQLNITNDKARAYNKRFTCKSKQIAVNKTVCKYLDDILTDKNREFLIAHNYCNIDLKDDTVETLVEMLIKIRNAHYESIAQALENALEIEFKTTAKSKSKSKSKAS